MNETGDSARLQAQRKGAESQKTKEEKGISMSTKAPEESICACNLNQAGNL